MALHTRYHQQDTDELSTHHGIIFIYPMDETLLCSIPCALLLGHERRKGGENHMAKDLDGAFLRLCLFLSQLVALSIADRKNWSGFALHLHAVYGLYLSADGWCMDEPTTQKQPDGRCVQHGEREFHQETRLMSQLKLFGKPTYTLLL